MTTSSIERAILQRPQSRVATIDDDGTIKSPSGQSVSTGGPSGGTGLTPEQDAKLSGLPDAAALAASLAGKIGTDKLGAPSGVAELDSTGKLKASQLPASALVDVSATGAALSAGVLSFTQDEGGPTITVDLNSFATDAEVTAGLDGKASTAQGAKADTALQPGQLPVGTTVTAAQVSDAGAAGRTLLQVETLPEIQALVSGDSTAQATSRSLTASDHNDVIFVSGAPSITIPPGLGNKFRTSIYGTATIVAGSGVTVTDARAAASVAAICVILPTATADNYVLIGGVL